MSAKNQGKLNGIRGRLGDLGYIDKMYEIAISTACGTGLNKIIVDRFNDGSAAIDFLRKNKIGK